MDTVNESASESLGLMVEINPSARFIEAVAEKVKVGDPVTGLPMKEVVEKLVDNLSLAAIATEVAEHICASDVAEYVCTSSVAEIMCENIDYYEITSNIDTSDIAEYVCASDVAEYVDVSAVAGHISVSSDDVIAGLDYKQLATSILEVLTRQQRLEVEAAYHKAQVEADKKEQTV